MAQHKIQSSTGLTLELAQVPKRLGQLTREWAPRSFVVSFKLETDEAILFQKAGGAIEKYAVNLVVANLLHNRADLCYLVAPAPSVSSPVTDKGTKRGTHAAAVGGKDRVETVDGRRLRIQVVQREPGEAQIEPLLVHCVVAQYLRFLDNRGVTQSRLGATLSGPVQIREYVDMVTQPSEVGEVNERGRKVTAGCCSWEAGRGYWVPLTASVAMLALGVLVLRKDRSR